MLEVGSDGERRWAQGKGRPEVERILYTEVVEGWYPELGGSR